MNDLIDEFLYGVVLPQFDYADGASMDFIRKKLIELYENLKAKELCLTGQEKVNIFQREEQAPKETPRPE